jgi:hypothetical protein
VAVGESVSARDGLAGADVAGGVVGDREGRAEAAAAADGLDVVRLLVDGVEAGGELAVGGARLLARVREDVGRADVSDEVVLVPLGAGGRDEGSRVADVAAAGWDR